ncbi:hypothetical protein HanHA300_Chr16g0624951 [Helianthus annuus]|nr:hypothetical protein HanHA300_Chr16g0624951 [Helianthus annuus]KAJ0444485.1 hypothetical protein HanIR_Chr16g0832341 [Helianthus annuus]KAJ0642158.1 hypothetical protein HanLR1_Chr16g0635231 [Helianthus annuus]
MLHMLMLLMKLMVQKQAYSNPIAHPVTSRYTKFYYLLSKHTTFNFRIANNRLCLVENYDSYTTTLKKHCFEKINKTLLKEKKSLCKIRIGKYWLLNCGSKLTFAHITSS